MIKKRYLMILSFAIISVLLGSLLYTSITLAGKPVPQPAPVEVTNFPAELNVLVVHHTLNVTFAINRQVGPSGHTYTKNVAGYRQVTLGINSTGGNDVIFHIYWVIGGVEYLNAEIILSGRRSTAKTSPVQFEAIKIHVSTTSGYGTYFLGLYATD